MCGGDGVMAMKVNDMNRWYELEVDDDYMGMQLQLLMWHGWLIDWLGWHVMYMTHQNDRLVIGLTYEVMAAYDPST